MFTLILEELNKIFQCQAYSEIPYKPLKLNLSVERLPLSYVKITMKIPSLSTFIYADKPTNYHQPNLSLRL